VPIGEHAEVFFKSGPPLLQRVLPFWLASLVDRLKVLLVPLVMLLLPLVRAAPPLVRWRTRRKVYRWYAALRDVDRRMALGLTASQIDEELARVRDIDRQVNTVQVPLGYMHEFYHLRLHLKMLQEQLEKLPPKQSTGK
jgi:hypothetical protein